MKSQIKYHFVIVEPIKKQYQTLELLQLFEKLSNKLLLNLI